MLKHLPTFFSPGRRQESHDVTRSRQKSMDKPKVSNEDASRFCVTDSEICLPRVLVKNRSWFPSADGFWEDLYILPLFISSAQNSARSFGVRHLAKHSIPQLSKRNPTA